MQKTVVCTKIYLSAKFCDVRDNMPDRRYRKTLSLMKTHLPAPAGSWTWVDNPFSEIMRKEGYTVDNTGGRKTLDEEVSLAKGNRL